MTAVTQMVTAYGAASPPARPVRTYPLGGAGIENPIDGSCMPWMDSVGPPLRTPVGHEKRGMTTEVLPFHAFMSHAFARLPVSTGAPNNPVKSAE